MTGSYICIGQAGNVVYVFPNCCSDYGDFFRRIFRLAP